MNHTILKTLQHHKNIIQNFISTTHLNKQTNLISMLNGTLEHRLLNHSSSLLTLELTPIVDFNSAVWTKNLRLWECTRETEIWLSYVHCFKKTCFHFLSVWLFVYNVLFDENRNFFGVSIWIRKWIWKWTSKERNSYETIWAA